MRKFALVLGLQGLFIASHFTNVHAAISVGPGGSGTITFSNLPLAGEWSTIVHGGGGGDIGDAGGVDTAAAPNPASVITNVLGSTATTAPAISSSTVARW